MKNNTKTKNVFQIVAPEKISVNTESKIIKVKALFTLLKLVTVNCDDAIEEYQLISLISDVSEIGENLCQDLMKNGSL